MELIKKSNGLVELIVSQPVARDENIDSVSVERAGHNHTEDDSELGSAGYYMSEREENSMVNPDL